MSRNKFTVKIDGKDVELAVVTPTLDQLEEAQRQKNRRFVQALESKAILKAKLDSYLREQNLWDDAKQNQVDTLEREIADAEKAILSGGRSINDGKKVAIKLRKLRDERANLLLIRKQLENQTAEGQADNAHFNYLVSQCVVYNDSDKPYFKDLADYIFRSNEPASYAAASNFASLLYGYDNDFEQKLPENQFLLNYGFVDKQYRLVDKQGRLVDEKDRLINEDGNLIDEDGNLIDHLGNKLDKDGNYIVEFKPFTDDEGNPIYPKKDEPVEPIEPAQLAEPAQTVNEEPSPA